MVCIAYMICCVLSTAVQAESGLAVSVEIILRAVLSMQCAEPKILTLEDVVVHMLEHMLMFSHIILALSTIRQNGKPLGWLLPASRFNQASIA